MSKMLQAISEMIVRRNIEKALLPYGIRVVHFIPGRLRVQLHGWGEREVHLTSLITELKKDKSVTSVQFTKETGTALIYYDHSSVNEETLKRWMSLFQKYA